jgi:hypothetical protein
MSLRPQVWGFDLAHFQSLFGSRDEDVLSDVEARQARWRGVNDLPPDESEQEEFQLLLRRAVNEGVPFPELAEESHTHVQLAIAMAGVGQEPYDARSDYWTWRAFLAFWEDHAASLDPRGRSLFGCFLKGRPVFGKRITGDTYYGYLNRRDVVTLRDSLRQRLGGLSGDASAFASDLAGWLDAIESHGRDLWFYFL